ncbi:MAG TPA: bifunctional homocysteine S-methyltransferase/methylenetetrahydrofolate reductase [Alphaproteobacteria bacterium]|nr:bifunctional homocysteine S-methyltransferase/methylenetetrahydrofolate reductase [Alphaproteobacteria bacterium]
MEASNIRTLLRERPIVADGGMGSLIYQTLGYPPALCIEQTPLTHPETVLQIHLAYIAAGAELIQVHSYGANRVKLAPYGLAEKAVAINSQAVKLAREAKEISGKDVLIAGSISPLELLGYPTETVDAEARHVITEVVQEQARTLEGRGVDLFILETYASLAELTVTIEAIRAQSSLPIIAQMTFTDDGKTLTGVMPQQAAGQLRDLGVDVIGLNCGVGPLTALEVLRAFAPLVDVPLAIQPNAGFPRRVGGRTLYPLASPELFSEFTHKALALGARLIGGCCGTTPQHIAAVARTLRTSPSTQPVVAAPPPPVQVTTHPPEEREGQTVERPPRSSLLQKLQSGQFVVSVQLDPPKGTNLGRILKAAAHLKASGKVDVVDINSNPVARVMMDSLITAGQVEDKVGMPTIPHVTTREINIMGLQSLMLGAWGALKIRNVLAVTGDPPQAGDYPEAKGVYEVDAIGLVKLLSNFNRGVDWMGKSLGTPTQFTIGVAMNPTAEDLAREIERFEAKVQAGAHFVMTQPIFDLEQWESFLRVWDRPLPIPFLIGLWPLSSYELARRLHHEVPGIVIPEAVQERLRLAGSHAKEEGIHIAEELLAELAHRPEVAGTYIICPFNRYELALTILDAVVLPK